MKTPEQMAEEYTRYWWPDFNDVKTCCQAHLATRQGFIAGYQAAKDEEATKDQKIAELWTESIKKMLPSVHEVVLFPGNSTKASEADKARDAEIIAKMDAATKKAKSNFTNNSNGWISVKERLPEEGKMCVVQSKWHGVLLSERINDRWLLKEDDGHYERPTHWVTHWMPLPEAPKEEK